MLSIFSCVFYHLDIFFGEMFKSPAHFFIRFFVFLMLSYMSCLRILEINLLSVASFPIIFSHSEGYMTVAFFNNFSYFYDAGCNKPDWQGGRNKLGDWDWHIYINQTLCGYVSIILVKEVLLSTQVNFIETHCICSCSFDVFVRRGEPCFFLLYHFDLFLPLFYMWQLWFLIMYEKCRWIVERGVNYKYFFERYIFYLDDSHC